MKTLGEVALDLPYLVPSATTLVALARAPSWRDDWSRLRFDPGFLVLLAQNWGSSGNVPGTQLLQAFLDAPVRDGMIDWNQPHIHARVQFCFRQAIITESLAKGIQGVDPRKAWIAGFLAPLGWFLLGVTESDSEMMQMTNPYALARRISRLWRFPSWLSTVVGHLGLPVDVAESLGCDRTLFLVCQAGSILAQQAEHRITAPLSVSLAQVAQQLGVATETLESLVALDGADPIPVPWRNPHQEPLLRDLLQIAVENQARYPRAMLEELHRDVDLLQEAFERQRREQEQRVRDLKLSAVAELAAGAGHEINNPLAVISGQAQYILKQMAEYDGPADEIEDVSAYLADFRTKVEPSLQKIVQQTQRIHTIITDLMQFARPQPPKTQAVPVQDLLKDVSRTLEGLARDRKLDVEFNPGDAGWALAGDFNQLRTVFLAMLRNAMEAAPVGGNVRLLVERRDEGNLEFAVEDNGPGPTPSACEHMFDPFYSGRDAGRGRGLGLSTAWRLAKQHGGEVRFAGHHLGVTRFVATLPISRELKLEDAKPRSAAVA